MIGEVFGVLTAAALASLEAVALPSVVLAVNSTVAVNFSSFLV